MKKSETLFPPSKCYIRDCDSSGHDSKLETLIQKMKVKTWDFNSYFLDNKSYHIRVYTCQLRKKLTFDI